MPQKKPRPTTTPPAEAPSSMPLAAGGASTLATDPIEDLAGQILSFADLADQLAHAPAEAVTAEASKALLHLVVSARPNIARLAHLALQRAYCVLTPADVDPIITTANAAVQSLLQTLTAPLILPVRRSLLEEAGEVRAAAGEVARLATYVMLRRGPANCSTGSEAMAGPPEKIKPATMNAIIAAYVLGRRTSDPSLSLPDLYKECLARFGEDNVQDSFDAFRKSVGRWLKRLPG